MINPAMSNKGGISWKRLPKRALGRLPAGEFSTVERLADEDGIEFMARHFAFI
jgi:hypothetical protein